MNIMHAVSVLGLSHQHICSTRMGPQRCPLCHTGHHSWGLYPEPPPVPAAVGVAPRRPGAEDVRAAVEQVTAVLGGIFTPLFFRGLFAFLTWWVAACQVVTSLFGLYFHQYLAAS